MLNHLQQCTTCSHVKVGFNFFLSEHMPRTTRSGWSWWCCFAVTGANSARSPPLRSDRTLFSNVQEAGGTTTRMRALVSNSLILHTVVHMKEWCG